MPWLRLLLKEFVDDIARSIHDQHSLRKSASKDNQPVVFWVPGDPATFATSGEKTWKEIIARTIPVNRAIEVYGLDMQFFLQKLAPRGHYLDVDNLCEPVFSVLVNRLGWFKGKRQNIRWWCAFKTEHPESGMKLTIYPTSVSEINLGVVNLSPIFDETYIGELTRSATDPIFSQWMRKQVSGAITPEQVAMLLRFGDPQINLGEAMSGRVKSLIDGLFPLLGGERGKPEDWRIKTLAVEKGTRDLTPNSVSITIWEAKVGKGIISSM